MILSSLLLSTYANIVTYWWLPLLAVALDRAFGDPPKLPHPVRAIGSLLAYVEPRARKLPRPDFNKGLVAVFVVLGITYLATRGLLFLPLLGILSALYLSFAGLALGQLLREGTTAVRYLEQGNITAARSAVGYLVSRDVSGAGHDELCRVLAESLAENMNDAFTAPLFWLIAGGPVTLWLYKAASTMDSTWGYPHEPWTRFGTAAARLDDALAYVPARLTALLLLLTAKTIGLNASWRMFAKIRADAVTMKSPNAGWPMAACAWILGASMGGKAVYAGKIMEKPLLGPEKTTWTTGKLLQLIRLLGIAGYTTTVSLWALGLAPMLL